MQDCTSAAWFTLHFQRCVDWLDMCLCRIADFKTGKFSELTAYKNSNNIQRTNVSLFNTLACVHSPVSSSFDPSTAGPTPRQAAQKSRSNKHVGTRDPSTAGSKQASFRGRCLARRVNCYLQILYFRLETESTTRQLLRQTIPFIFIHRCWFAMD
jgi:hypothetical protein